MGLVRLFVRSVSADKEYLNTQYSSTSDNIRLIAAHFVRTGRAFATEYWLQLEGAATMSEAESSCAAQGGLLLTADESDASDVTLAVAQE